MSASDEQIWIAVRKNTSIANVSGKLDGSTTGRPKTRICRRYHQWPTHKENKAAGGFLRVAWKSLQLGMLPKSALGQAVKSALIYKEGVSLHLN